MQDFIDQLDHCNFTKSKDLYRLINDHDKEAMIIEHVARLIAEEDSEEVNADYHGAAKDFLNRE